MVYRDAQERQRQHESQCSYNSSGWYKIRNRNYDKCLNLQQEGNRNGGNVHVYECGEHADQEWQLQPLNNGWYKIRNRNYDKCLNLQQEGNRNGGNVHVWECVEHADQEWQLERR